MTTFISGIYLVGGTGASWLHFNMVIEDRSRKATEKDKYEKGFYSATLYGKETGNPFLYNKKDKKR